MQKLTIIKMGSNNSGTPSIEHLPKFVKTIGGDLL